MFNEFDIGALVPGTSYRVVAEIGRGGMGSVYEVEHLELGKRFVLKALLAEYVCRDDLVLRLRNEWRALGRLEHPNIVSVTDAGVADNGVPYYVMERLQGETLGARIKRLTNLEIEESLTIAAEILEGLAAAHAIGVVHRDVKPPNIFLTRTGVAKVLDFGIAKLLDGNASITRRGHAIGTPRYMSPEQASGAVVDARADLYAVGLLLFEMLSGRSPFEGCDDKEVFLAHIFQRPKNVAELVPGIPAEVDRLVSRLLAKSPQDRPGSARRAAEALRSMLRGISDRPSSDTLAHAREDALTPVLQSAHGDRDLGSPSARVEVDHGARGDGPTESRVPSSRPPWQVGVISRTELLGDPDGHVAATRTAAPVDPARPRHSNTPPRVASSAPRWNVETGIAATPPPPKGSTSVVVAAAMVGATVAIGAFWLLSGGGSGARSVAGQQRQGVLGAEAALAAAPYQIGEDQPVKAARSAIHPTNDSLVEAVRADTERQRSAPAADEERGGADQSRSTANSTSSAPPTDESGRLAAGGLVGPRAAPIGDGSVRRQELGAGGEVRRSPPAQRQQPSQPRPTRPEAEAPTQRQLPGSGIPGL
jgi:serine/threonine-protein kinase